MHELETVSLQSLSLSSLAEWVELYNPLWSRLRVLTLHGHWFSDPGTETEVNEFIQTMPSTNIQILNKWEVDRYEQTRLKLQCALIAKSPGLVQLRWYFQPNQSIKVLSAMAMLVEAI